MNSQVNVLLPIPMIETIILLSSLRERISFRASCKRFLWFTTEKFFPTFTTTLCGSGEEGYLDGDALVAKFCHPHFGVLDSPSNILFVSDCGNHVIRKIELSTNRVSTLCGTPGKGGWKDGIGSESQFSFPVGLALNEKEKILFVSDLFNHVIRSVSLMDGRVETIYGKKGSRGRKDGIGNESTFSHPSGLAFDSISNHLYVADGGNHSIRRIILNERRVETLCGNGNSGYFDGSFEESMFNFPFDISFNSLTEDLYVSDSCNHIIRVISLKDRRVFTLCGTPQVFGFANGTHNQAKFDTPGGLGLDINFNWLYVCDEENRMIRKISLLKEVRVDTLCGMEENQGSRDGFFPTFDCPRGIVVDPRCGSFYVIESGTHKVRKIRMSLSDT